MSRERIDLPVGRPRRRICRIRVGAGLLGDLVRDLAEDPPGSPLVIVSDDRVAPLHGAPLLERLRRAGLAAELVTFPHGEANKNRETKRLLEDRLVGLRCGRDSAVLALGGGVTGDLAGFVAATWHRGVPVVQVPTSLMAMADAAIGGKTAVNLAAGKNLVGSFHQPWGVYADVSLLSTLPDTELVQGFSEMVKSAVVADAKLFRWLEANAGPLRARDPGALEHAVGSCIRIKARVVARDEREAGRRVVLNFGHTVAHALEATSGFTVGHGRAVSIGLCAESRLARALTGFPRSQVDRVESMLAALGLPTRLPAGTDLDRLLRATRADKKVRAGQVRYALPRRIGRMLPAPEFTVVADESAVRSVLAELH